jgi:hypothetical protein
MLKNKIQLLGLVDEARNTLHYPSDNISVVHLQASVFKREKRNFQKCFFSLRLFSAIVRFLPNRS